MSDQWTVFVDKGNGSKASIRATRDEFMVSESMWLGFMV